MSDERWIPLPIGGAIRIVGDTIMIRCPACGHEGIIDDDQFHGRVSINHDDCGRQWKPSLCDCTWHETHDLASMIAEASA